MEDRVDIGGRQLYMEVAGTGAPTVILEAGAGCASDTWDPIWADLTQVTRAVRYDRANLGRSDKELASRSGMDAAVELATLLTRAGIAGPYILVGHSFGGIFVRLFRDRHPDKVAGLILLDASHHAQTQRLLSLLPPEAPHEPAEVTRLRQRYSDPALQMEEGIRHWESQREAAAVAPLGGLPLAVVSRAITPAESVTRQMPDYPLELAVSSEQAWREMQADLARLSSHSTHVIAERSGHHVHRDQPELVLGTIRHMVSQIVEQGEGAHDC